MSIEYRLLSIGNLATYTKIDLSTFNVINLDI